MTNPFRIHGVVGRPAFADRDRELGRVRATLGEPGAKLLVLGERRIGKTSLLCVGLEDNAAAGGAAILADFSTATSTADLCNRLLSSAGRAMGRRWRDALAELPGRVGLKLELGVDPVTQLPTVGIGVELRDAPADRQREVLGRVLDALDQMAAARSTSLGVVLDEFQEIHRLGGEEAEWHLRGVIQHHAHLSYVVAGSQTNLIGRMLSKGRAFYRLFEVLEVGPIDAVQLSAWIDRRMTESGVNSEGAGAAAISLAGDRTRDVVQLARRAYELAIPEGAATPDTVDRAFGEIVSEESDPWRALWAGYSAAQQNVLRAIAAGTEALTSAAALRRFGLHSSAAAAAAARRLQELDAIVQVAPGRYRFDSPFQRGWVIANALPDLGIHLPVTHRPG